MKIVGSIVLPAYQSSSTLRRALDSIVNSQIAQCATEVVVVFDGIDEQSESIFQEWSKDSPIPAKSKIIERSGVSVARNVGANEATGQNIAFLDCDDEFTAARMAEFSGDLSGLMLIGKQELIVEREGSYEPSLLHPSEFHLMSFVMKREDFLALGGFSNGYGVGAEWDLSIRAREAGILIREVDKVFIKRHIDDKNRSHGNKLVKSEHLKAIREHLTRKST